MLIRRILIFTVLFSVFCSGLETNYYWQKANTNTDFLLHEAGSKRNYVAPNIGDSKSQNTLSGVGNSNYHSEFPALGGSSSATAKPTVKWTENRADTTIGSGKRDYVAPNHLSTPKVNQVTNPTQAPIINTQSTTAGNKNYFSQFPALGGSTAATSTITNSGKRDYVAPNYPTTRTTQATGSGKVKDLINFFQNNDKSQDPQSTPSFSSILQRNKMGSTTAVPLPSSSSSQTPKPASFGSVVSGSNKPSTVTTPRTTSRQPNNGPARPTTGSSGKPGSGTVLPSSIVNRNQNGNNNNNQATTNGPSDNELQALSEELLRKDINNAAKYITINYQEKTTSFSKEDKAPLPLLTISPSTWNIPTIQKFVPLLDNYERDTLVNEYVTPQERIEENSFMDAIMSTTVIRHLMTFLKDKGYVTPDPKQQRDFLKQLWFSLYSRGKGKISSSGFEHIFVSELKNGEVSGLHNWIYFSKEEFANRANYLGYLKYENFNDKGAVLKFHFNQLGTDKPVDTMFIGTSPELEIALYTLCFVTRHDTDCNLKLGNKNVNIVTHTFRYRSKNLIGSAYPQI